MQREPFFYDITLRDGNQSLKRPWDTKEKEIIFNHLVNMGVQGIEIGFPCASEMEFSACRYIAEKAPSEVVVSCLARAVERDIEKAVESLEPAKNRRVHTFITMSPFNMRYVLNREPEMVKRQAIEAVEYAKKKLGGRGDIEFSVEHFGDCIDNLDWVIGALKEVVQAGATTINLPNTVERYRIKTYVDMVEKVYKALSKEITISVHCHNDLGMATAATVESYFAGAKQMECSLNGLGERAGNTNMYEVAVALYNSGVKVPLHLDRIYETALLVSEMSNVKIPERAPLIGTDALAHRSGMHQDGACKTMDMEKGAYRAIHPSLIGRNDREKIVFTSQSGKTALFEILSVANCPITIQEAIRIQPVAKKAAEKQGELSTFEVIELYKNEILNPVGEFELVEFERISGDEFELKFKHKGKVYIVKSNGNGPLAACLNALEKAGFPQKLLHYEQLAIDEDVLGSEAIAMSIIHLEGKQGESVVARATDTNTAKANVHAIFNGLNIINN